jgi:homotetrameric cytidine deaminase
MSTYLRVPVADAPTLHDALDAAYGTLVTVTKRRRLLLWEGVRIHLDEVDGLGSFLEFEAVAEEGSDLSAEHEKVERLRAELDVKQANLVARSYSDLLLGEGGDSRSAEELLAAAEAVMREAYAPYSEFPVGAALRAKDGSIHVGANIENASYPQGQCAETSAIGALHAAGHTKIAEVAVVAEKMDVCPPCGGCRQRLAEFASADTPVHLGRPGGPRVTTTVGELLPLAFELEPPE